MRLLFLDTHSNIKGPLPKIFPEIIKSLRTLGCEVITRPWGQKNSNETSIEKVLRGLGDLLEICRVIRRERFDVLLVNTAHNWRSFIRDIPLLYAARLLGQQKTVILFHGSQAENLLKRWCWLLRILSRWVLNLSSAVFLLSTDEKKAWKKFCPNIQAFVVRLPRVSEPIALEKDRDYISVPHDAPIVLFVGRIIKEKGVIELVEALPKVLTAIKCHLLLVGDGSDLNTVIKKISALGLEEFVTVTGYLCGARLHQAYHQATVFVLPTYFPEGFPVVLLEAMGAGLPIITTRARGAADWLNEPMNALFIPPKDPKSLAEVMIILLSNPSLMKTMGDANRILLNNFEPTGVAVDYIRAFEEIIST